MNPLSVFKSTPNRAAVRLAQAQAHAEATRTDLESAQTAYAGAVSRAAAADTTETLELRRAGEHLERKRAVHNRALDVLAAAQQQVAAAQTREQRAALVLQWAEAEAAAGKRTAAALEVEQAAAVLGAAIEKARAAAAELWAKLPAEQRAGVSVFAEFNSYLENELRRARIVPWFPDQVLRMKPLTEECRRLDDMLRRLRAEALAQPTDEAA